MDRVARLLRSLVQHVSRLVGAAVRRLTLPGKVFAGVVGVAAALVGIYSQVQGGRDGEPPPDETTTTAQVPLPKDTIVDYAINSTALATCAPVGGHGGGAVRALAFDATGARLYSGGNDAVVRTWDLSTGVCTPIATLDRRVDAAVASLLIDPTTNLLLAGTEGGRLWAWPLNSPDPAPVAPALRLAPSNLNGLAVVGSVLYAGGFGGEIKAVELPALQPLPGKQLVAPNTSQIMELHARPGATELLVVGREGAHRSTDGVTLRPIATADDALFSAAQLAGGNIITADGSTLRMLTGRSEEEPFTGDGWGTINDVTALLVGEHELVAFGTSINKPVLIVRDPYRKAAHRVPVFGSNAVSAVAAAGAELAYGTSDGQLAIVTITTA